MRMLLMLLIWLLPAAFAIWCIVRLFRNRNPRFLYQWQRGVGWLALCVLPVPLLVIAKNLIENGGFGGGSWVGLAALSINWLVLLGGKSVITIFEANAKSWTGHRHDTMFDNVHVFMGLMLIQVLLLSLLVAWRLHKGKSLRDPVVIGVGLFMLLNAVLGMDWPWYGT